MKRTRFLLTTVLSILIFAGIFLSGSAEAEAKKPYLKKYSSDYFVSGIDSFTRTYGSYMSELDIKNATRLSKITDLKSSKPGIVEGLRWNKDLDGKVRILFFPVKAGSTTISCKVKQGGKTYKLSKKITVYSGKPFKSIKINKTVYGDKDNTYNKIDLFNMKNKKVKVKVSLNSGWSLHKMYYTYHTTYNRETPTHKMKNGGTVKAKGSTSVCVEAKNKKTKKIYHLLINLNPNNIK